MVGITSWVIRIGGLITLAGFFTGAVAVFLVMNGLERDELLDYSILTSGGILMGVSFLTSIMIGSAAVLFRQSEQMDEMNQKLDATNQHLTSMYRMQEQLDESNRYLASIRLLTSQGMGVEAQVHSEKIIGESDDESSQHEGGAAIPIR